MKHFNELSTEVNRIVAELVEARVEAFLRSLGTGETLESNLSSALVSLAEELRQTKDRLEAESKSKAEQCRTYEKLKSDYEDLLIDNQMLNKLVDDQETRLSNQRITIEMYQQRCDVIESIDGIVWADSKKGNE